MRGIFHNLPGYIWKIVSEIGTIFNPFNGYSIKNNFKIDLYKNYNWTIRYFKKNYSKYNNIISENFISDISDFILKNSNKGVSTNNGYMFLNVILVILAILFTPIFIIFFYFYLTDIVKYFKKKSHNCELIIGNIILTIIFISFCPVLLNAMTYIVSNKRYLDELYINYFLFEFLTIIYLGIKFNNLKSTKQKTNEF